LAPEGRLVNFAAFRGSGQRQKGAGLSAISMKENAELSGIIMEINDLREFDHAST
jgi:hypothetical protein